MDIMKILPADTTNFYTYDGSLTTPPCMEGVRWIVLKEPIQFSRVQVDRFVLAYGHTARLVQPLHGREGEANQLKPVQWNHDSPRHFLFTHPLHQKEE